jgi:Nickel responsive protein SCO4226-like
VADCFLVEVYAPEAAADLGAEVERVRTATRALAREGVDLRYRHALLMRRDETCFHLLEAPSAEAVMEASKRAGLKFERIVEVELVESLAEGSPDHLVRGGRVPG